MNQHRWFRQVVGIDKAANTTNGRKNGRGVIAGDGVSATLVPTTVGGGSR
jgi:hypothetical protein